MKCEQWQLALALFSEALDTRLESNVISWNVAISACETGEQWQLALSLFNDMQEAKLEPDVASYNIVINVCGNGEQ
eukprot:1543436-Pyramimonas_sp.AAC.1